MKKFLTSALTAALILGASSTALAASNPFSDVPAGHWAYQSVAKLAAAGVIEGYGDGTYRGERNITRYEMAQMIAKAMAKNPTGASKAELDRLAAEFRDELDALGVRVSELEKYSDKVIWHGKVRIWSEETKHDVNPLTGRKNTKSTNNVFLLRLEPRMIVNDHWQIRTRIEGRSQLHKDSTGTVDLKRAWAEGTYGNNVFRVGRMPMGIDMDLLFETQFSGAQFVTGKNLKATFSAGCFDLNNASDYFKYGVTESGDRVANYQAVALSYKDSGKLSGNIAYHHLGSDSFRDMIGYGNKKDANIATARVIYSFDGNVTLVGNYGKNFSADKYGQTYNILLGYKDYDSVSKKQGDWGAYVAYRHLAPNVSLAPTYVMPAGVKGWEFGLHQTIFQNVMLQGRYITGKDILNNKKAKKFFVRAELYF